MGSHESAGACVLKHCPGCNQTLADTDFYRKPNGKLKSWCKRCTLRSNKAWKVNHRERNNAISREWCRKNPDKRRAVQNAYRAKNREYVRERFRLYREANREAFRHYGLTTCIRRRQREKDARIQDFTTGELDARMSMFGHLCAYCGGPFETIDHVISLYKGGKHCLSNLRPACRSCNSSKQIEDLVSWLKRRALVF